MRSATFRKSLAGRLRTTLLVIAALLFLSWLALWLGLAQPDPRQSPPSRVQVSTHRLERHVRMLSESLLPRHGRHLGNMKRTADYLSNEFKAVGIGEVSDQWFEISGSRYRNVSLLIGDASLPRIIIGAHYDAYGPYPGADDNASGVAGIIELARLFSRRTPFPRTAIELVGYPLEEPPYFRTNRMGSWSHAQALHKNQHPFRYMISIEMIGYFSDQLGSQTFPTPLLKSIYPSRGNFITVVGNLSNRSLIRQFKIGMRGSTDLPVHSMSGPASIPGLDFSDHRNYWSLGYPAIMITDTSFYRNLHYHTAEDTADRLDFDKMGQVVTGVYEAICRIENRRTD